MEAHMSHKPIIIKNLSYILPHKICFADFSAHIGGGDKIAIIGKNGSGKSSLLKIIQGLLEPSDGTVIRSNDVEFGYLPQALDNLKALSGAERINKRLSEIIAKQPNFLCLDEPTNHLDRSNKKSLMQMLNKFRGTTLIVTHDVELITRCLDTVWHIDNYTIRTFTGDYEHYVSELSLKRGQIEKEIHQLNLQKKQLHESLMKQQVKSSKSKAAGQKKLNNKKWMKSTADLKAMGAQKSQGRITKNIENKKTDLTKQLCETRLPEKITPKFYINPQILKTQHVVSIRNGGISYPNHENILNHINLEVSSTDRVAVLGNNGSGKTTLLNAILTNHKDLVLSGTWDISKPENIGYLDQNYTSLNLDASPLEAIQSLTPHWSHDEVRKHLNNFLFKKNEEVNANISTLSGGEKARLSLAKIGAKTPNLLILDEVTNNLDIETRAHVIDVLLEYPSAIIIVSHDELFLKSIKLTHIYEIINGSLVAQNLDMLL